MKRIDKIGIIVVVSAAIALSASCAAGQELSFKVPPWLSDVISDDILDTHYERVESNLSIYYLPYEVKFNSGWVYRWLPKNPADPDDFYMFVMQYAEADCELNRIRYPDGMYYKPRGDRQNNSAQFPTTSDLGDDAKEWSFQRPDSRGMAVIDWLCDT